MCLGEWWSINKSILLKTVDSIGDLRNAVNIRFRFGWAVVTCGEFYLSFGSTYRTGNVNGLGQSVFQHHVVDWRQRQASTENVLNGRSLAIERVDDRCSFWN